MKQIEDMLNWLQRLCERRYALSNGRSVNYEDLAYLASQIRDDALDEYENPALVPLVCGSSIALPYLFSEQQGKSQQLGTLAGDTVDYITDVVEYMLRKRVSGRRRGHLKFFKDAARDAQFGVLGFFTLNHDTILEQYLTRNGVQIVDGFSITTGERSRQWNPTLFDRPGAVPIYKLHGSVDWRRFRVNDSEEYVGIPPQNIRPRGMINRALILMGTFNKMFGYLSDVFLELHTRFYRALMDSEALIVGGYGFGDKGINNRISDFMRSGRKLVVIDCISGQNAREKARGAIAQKWETWQRKRCLIYFDKGFGPTTWPEVKRALLKA